MKNNDRNNKNRKFTATDVRRMYKEGKIRDYKITGPEKPVKIPGYKKPSKEKAWMELNLQYWCNQRSLEMKSEYRFHERKWRFDYVIESLKIAIEYEGIYSEKSRHTTAAGFTGDTDKYNQGATKGWRIIRFTAKNYLTMVRVLDQIYDEKNRNQTDQLGGEHKK